MVFGVEGYTWYLLIEDSNFCNFQMQIDYLNICEPNQNHYTYTLFMWFSLSPFALMYCTIYLCTIFVFKIIKFVTKISQNFATIQTFAPKKRGWYIHWSFSSYRAFAMRKITISTLVISNNSNSYDLYCTWVCVGVNGWSTNC